MITCARCGQRMRRDPYCSDLAVISLHWMERHPGAYGDLHPETRPYLRRLP